MPVHKPDLSQLSLNQLCELTGKTYRTVAKRLADADVTPVREDGKTLFYAPKQALAAIYREGDSSDPFAEKKRLDGVRADLAELELAKKRGELLPGPETEIAWVAVASAVRTRILAVPAATAQELAASTSPSECHGIVEAALYDALTELADAKVTAPARAEDPGA